MRKLHVILLAATLSIVTLATTVAPAFAGKPQEPSDHQPVAWVDSAVNTNSRLMEMDPPVKTSHSIHVKVLADNTTVGVVEYHNYITKDTGHFTNFDQTMTRFYVQGDGAKVAEIVALAPREGLPDYHIKYHVVDYGEPSNYDWHMVFIWWPEWPESWAEYWEANVKPNLPPGTPMGPVPKIWISAFGPDPIPYKGIGDKPLFGGNANVTITQAYYDLFPD